MIGVKPYLYELPPTGKKNGGPRCSLNVVIRRELEELRDKVCLDNCFMKPNESYL